MRGRAAAFPHQRLEVGAVDPVHRQDIAVAVEEVLAHQRKTVVRRYGEQGAGLAEQLLPERPVAHRADLQRDETVVLVVEGLDDPPLTPRAQRLEKLVALTDQVRGHGGFPTMRMWRRTWS